MPTILTHPVVPLALAVALGSQAIPKRLLLVGIVASVLPDLDVLAFRFGVAYSHDLGHRGMSHSLLFALLLGLAVMPFATMLQSTRKAVFVFIALCAASHGLLDMLTNGGLGVAFYWPFSSERLFFPFRVVQVSPISLSKLFSPAMLQVFKSEALWLWLPAACMALLTYTVRRATTARKPVNG
jgi:inner membrane protein